MVYHVSHWFKDPEHHPVPEAIRQDFPDGLGKYRPGWAVAPRDIHAFVLKHGPVQIHPPTADFPHWQIIVTDSSKRFGQR